ncbi:MAG: M20/M25/M40 family metallo-hydrolase [Capsulimonadaceae bacterium]
MSLDPLSLLKQLIAIPGPAGQEEAVRDAVEGVATSLGCTCAADPRGNLLISLPGEPLPERPDVLVMAHLDEIAMIVERYDDAGYVKVAPLGGLLPWKVGEGPVAILAPGGALTGILGFGSIHTNAPESRAVRAAEAPLTWSLARIFTGLSGAELEAHGVRPGTRVVLGEARRTVTVFGDYLAAPFLDDRADLVAMLLAIDALRDQAKGRRRKIAFAATASEEVGGHGALYLLRRLQPEVGIALEIGPSVPESPFYIDERPTVWVHDAYAGMQARDSTLVAAAAAEAGLLVSWQALSRGGSDASCGAAHGEVARPITLAFAAENSHGYEITHKESMPNLARLLVAVLSQLEAEV